MATTTFKDEEAQFLGVLAEHAHADLLADGAAYLGTRQADSLAAENAVPRHIADLVWEKLIDTGMIVEKSRLNYDATPLAIWYEVHQDRVGFRSRNALRRELLHLAASARKAGHELKFNEQGERFIDRSYVELMAAARPLEGWGFAKLREFLGRNFYLSITHEGYDLVGDEKALRQALPLDATEDIEAHAPVSGAALAEMIRSCEQLLEGRRWQSVSEELGRGDEQWTQGHWVDAVSEYYAAVESALKYRLTEGGAAYPPTAALKDLARQAAQHGLIPPNYQALFGFCDSIRSPRRHGRGPSIEEVEVGPAEALLLANHARALVLYLGHRPAI